jgi:hypothetical protein
MASVTSTDEHGNGQQGTRQVAQKKRRERCRERREKKKEKRVKAYLGSEWKAEWEKQLPRAESQQREKKKCSKQTG